MITYNADTRIDVSFVSYDTNVRFSWRLKLAVSSHGHHKLITYNLTLHKLHMHTFLVTCNV